MSSLYRTFNPKYAHYTSDGQGRDTYIIKNNGGLCVEPERAKMTSTHYPRTNLYVPPHPQYNQILFKGNRKEATAFKYLSDGSGRDSYILINSGGLHAPSVYG